MIKGKLKAWYNGRKRKTEYSIKIGNQNKNESNYTFDNNILKEIKKEKDLKEDLSRKKRQTFKPNIEYFFWDTDLSPYIIKINENKFYNMQFMIQNKIIKKYFEKTISEINVNRSLILNRYISFWYHKEENLDLNKSEFFAFIEKIGIDKETIKKLKRKNEKTLNLLEKTFGENNIETFKMPLKSRLIVGIGNPSPAETGMLLHHIYGIPYIPGSALKGIARWSAIVEIGEKTFEYKKKKENKKYDIYEHFAYIDKLIEKELKKEEVESYFKEEILYLIDDDGIKKEVKEKIEIARCVFGTKSTSGSILFLDAFPDENVRFKVDIMNPHYPEYYDKGKKPPADWQNPSPIPFLTVEGGKFEFVLVKTKELKICKDVDKDKALLNTAKKWLKKALSEYGVGAKTALGYGLFVPEEREPKNV